jgi:regulator of replication initiation timing
MCLLELVVDLVEEVTRLQMENTHIAEECTQLAAENTRLAEDHAQSKTT